MCQPIRDGIESGVDRPIRADAQGGVDAALKGDPRHLEHDGGERDDGGEPTVDASALEADVDEASRASIGENEGSSIATRP